MNDPNGLIRIDGVWHLFYQHEPHSTVHGPMHWGHASSPDLVTWAEHPIALHPDALGTCFSGSAIETPAGEIKLFYTAHRKHADGADFQVQCLVHADRGLTQFERDPHNPIIDNPGLPAFRDPKVLWHEPTNRWVMVLTHGQSIGIYSSADLRRWQLESDFGATDGQHGDGPWECPDLLPLTALDGSLHWVLIVGIGSDSPGGGSGTQYFIGQFDGHSFINDNPPATALWVDHGRDYYAAQSFFGAKDAVTIAWASNWQYARHTPTQAFRGSMSLPRQLGLADTPEGLRLRQTVPRSVSNEFESVAFGSLPASGAYRLAARLHFAHSASIGITLFGEASPSFVFTRSLTGHVTVRSIRAAAEGLPAFESGYATEIGFATALDIEIFVDHGLVELCIADGLLWLTNLFFPANCAAAARMLEDPDSASETVMSPIAGVA
jgi:fructan beta-fructosidase